MVRAFTLVAVFVGICCLCSCVGKFSLIDTYYATPEEGEAEVVEEQVEVEDVTGSPQIAGTESAVEVIEEEPLK